MSLPEGAAATDTVAVLCSGVLDSHWGKGESPVDCVLWHVYLVTFFRQVSGSPSSLVVVVMVMKERRNEVTCELAVGALSLFQLD